MLMENVILIAVIGCILGVALGYIFKAKKSGRKCIGCPESCQCGSCSGCCGKDTSADRAN